MIKAIAFDYGGVIEITDSTYKELHQKIANYLQVTLENWLEVYHSLNHLSATGKSSYQEVYALTAQKLGASDTQLAHIYEINDENYKTRKINVELIEIIKDLRNKNYKIGLISNNNIELRQKMINQNIIDYFDAVVVSSEVGYQKPQPEIYNILFKELGVSSNEIILVDDSNRPLQGAKDLGCTPLLYKNNKQLIEDLSTLGIKVF
jgi:epoxide hydrolase-like predicted phosphatase